MAAVEVEAGMVVAVLPLTAPEMMIRAEAVDLDMFTLPALLRIILPDVF